MGAFILRLVLVPFLNRSSEGFPTPRSELLRILGLEWLGHHLKVVVVKIQVETDSGQFSLLGTGHSVAMAFLRRTSRPRQLLTDNQQAMSRQKLTITSETNRQGRIQQVIPLSHAHKNRVEPGLTRSHGPLNPGSTRVSKVGSTLLTSRVEPGLRGVKVGYERIVDRDQVTWRPVGVFGATKKLQLC